MRTYESMENKRTNRVVISVIMVAIIVVIITAILLALLSRQELELAEQLKRAPLSNQEIKSIMRGVNYTRVGLMTSYITVLLLLIVMWYRSVQKEREIAQETIRRLTMVEEAFQILTRRSSKIIMRKEIATGKKTILNDDSNEDIPFLSKIRRNSNSWLSFVHPEDLRKEIAAKQLIANGQSEETHLVRLESSPNEYRWYKISRIRVLDSKGNPEYIMCVTQDIHESYISTSNLKERAEKDLATGLFNSTTTKNLITGELDQNKKGTFIILDVDDFKKVNDTYGHQVGDMVLRLLGNALTSTFNKNDIIGRLGGDEFIIYMKDCDDKEVVKAKIKELRLILSDLWSIHNLNQITASIGIAITEPNDTFENLYNKADSALYEMKNKGKNGFVIYTQDNPK